MNAPAPRPTLAQQFLLSHLATGQAKLVTYAGIGKAVLESRVGVPSWDHPYEYAISYRTIETCRRHGWLDGLKLTEAGRKQARPIDVKR